MATVTTYSCDECGTLRKESNHWFRALVLVDGRRFAIYQWEEDAPVLSDRVNQRELHLCSESCAIKAMSKAIGRAP